MANKPITMSKLRKVLQLSLNGKSKKFISNYLNLSRNTVKKYLIELNALNLSIEDIKKLSDLDLEKLFIERLPVVQSAREAALYKFFPYMEKELKKTGVTRMIIWQEYLAKHPDGFRRTQFNKRYNKWSKKEIVFTKLVNGIATLYIHMGYGNVATTVEFADIRLEKAGE